MMSNELAYWLALKRIAAFMDVKKLSKYNYYGLTRVETLEMAYENVLDEARRAVKGKRRPKE